MPPRARPSAPQLMGLVVGYAIIVVGAIGLLDQVGLRSSLLVTGWVVAADAAHDLLLAPVVCVAAFAITRLVPAKWRWPVGAAVLASATVLAFSYPALRGFGRTTAPGNTSVLPLDYPTATLTVLSVIWALALTWGLAVAAVHRRPGHRTIRRPSGPTQP